MIALWLNFFYHPSVYNNIQAPILGDSAPCQLQFKKK